MKKILIYLTGIAIVLGGLIYSAGFEKLSGMFALITGTPVATNDFKLSQEDLVNLVKPSVVRIVTDYSGTAEIAPFLILPDKDGLLSISLLSKNVPRLPPIPLDELDMTGSGFVINPDGYILTNAHVVSETTVKSTALLVYYGAILTLGGLSQDAILRFFERLDRQAKSSPELSERMEKEMSAVLEASTFNINKRVSVITQEIEIKETNQLLTNGIEASVVEIHDKWDTNERDVALLKVNHKNLPSVRLAKDGKLTTGQNLFIFGFPANARYTEEDFTVPSLTKGLLSAMKESSDKSFQMLQTDAKISEGSSGGPIFDESGSVVGITTAQTRSTKDGGDNFGFAIPLSVVTDILKKAGVVNSTAGFYDKFQSGISLLSQRRCKSAIQEFNLAKNANSLFSVNASVDPYIKNCEAVIASGHSIDNLFDEMREKVGGSAYVLWGIISGVGLGILAIIYFVIRTLRGRSATVYTNSTEYPAGDNQSAENSSAAGQPDTGLIKFVQDSKAAGIADSDIRSQLLSQGWDSNIIDSVLKSPDSVRP